MTADAFFTDLTGKVISVKGTLTGGVFVADEVEFEDAD
jgi:hypothetical protein